VLSVAVGLFIDEPLRRYVEELVNSRLQGYTVRLGKLDLHPLRFSVDLTDVIIVQDANPEPPIVYIPALHASLFWRALLSARIVSDVLVEHPKVYINLKQLRDEAADDLPVRDRGWQEALQAVTPIKMNVLRVVDGDVTYVDEDPARPLRLSQLNLDASNIRNIQSQAGEYPSDVHLRAVIFDSGSLWLEGHADFLAVPHAAIKAQLRIEGVELDYVKPVARRYNITLKGGTLAAGGSIEYAPAVKAVHIQKVLIEALRADYVHTAQAVRTGSERAEQVRRAQQATREVSNAPDLRLRADEVSIVKSELGFVNTTTNPAYRLVLSDLQSHLTRASNQAEDGPAVVKIAGKFMGNGKTTVGAVFRPNNQGPAFALAASIENTRLRTMNDLLRAHGKFDVVQGFFSVYSEFRVQDGMIRGYVKPLFKEMDVYDAHQDREKNLFQKMYEALVGGASKVLENIPRDEVATKAEVSGRVEDPQASTWQVLINLIQNAFFQSILPGFEQQLGRSTR
jgi:hypothetical protein